MFNRKENNNKHQEPRVEKVILEGTYSFMYKNFVLATQHDLYLILDENEGVISALSFSFIIHKYGYPNDEISHPYEKYGLSHYGLFEVKDSSWIREIRELNSTHARHKDEHFRKFRHFVVAFKDVTMEVIADSFAELTFTQSEFLELFKNEIKNLQD